MSNMIVKQTRLFQNLKEKYNNGILHARAPALLFQILTFCKPIHNGHHTYLFGKKYFLQATVFDNGPICDVVSFPFEEEDEPVYWSEGGKYSAIKL